METPGTPQTSRGRFRQTLRNRVFRLGKDLRKRLFRVLARQSLVGDPPIFAPGTFAWTAPLEQGAPAIRTELQNLLRVRDRLPPFQEISPDNGRIATADKWKVYLLWGFGEKAERNCALCPETDRILSGIPGLVSAWFSIMAPRYHVPSHRGVTKGVVRCHLGLVVPKERERCRMAVAKTGFNWEEGRCVVFDDTRRHEVWNDTDEERVVLLLDVERPMKPLGRFISRAFLWLLRRTAYFRDARRNFRDWETSFHAEYDRVREAAPSAA